MKNEIGRIKMDKIWELVMAVIAGLGGIGKKDYNGKPIIVNEWNLAKSMLSRATGITVYGYGAPVTDIEAVELMKSASHLS